MFMRDYEELQDFMLIRDPTKREKAISCHYIIVCCQNTKIAAD